MPRYSPTCTSPNPATNYSFRGGPEWFWQVRDQGFETSEMRRESKNGILEAAIDLFAEHGYAASVRSIADRADSATMTMYRAFRNKKENLFAEALEAVVRRSFDPGQFVLFIYEDQKAGDFISVLCTGLQRWYFAIHWSSARLLAHACLSDNPKWRETANAALERLVDTLATTIERQLPRAQRQEFDAQATARALVMLLFHKRWMRPAKTRPKAKKKRPGRSNLSSSNR